MGAEEGRRPREEGREEEEEEREREREREKEGCVMSRDASVLALVCTSPERSRSTRWALVPLHAMVVYRAG